MSAIMVLHWTRAWRWATVPVRMRSSTHDFKRMMTRDAGSAKSVGLAGMAVVHLLSLAPRRRAQNGQPFLSLLRSH